MTSDCGHTGCGMRTQICITIDTEFSIGGAFTYPDRMRPIGIENVTCPAGDQENGLGFLLDTFREFGISATFFVETLQSTYFGDAPMGHIVERVLRADQDVQLHLHPCWLAFRHPDWVERLSRSNPNDHCDGRSEEEMRDIIVDGMAALRQVGAPVPLAMRAGGLRADRTLYHAMSACGLRLASNIGTAFFPPRDPELRHHGGRHWIGDVLEVPVLTYLEAPLPGRAGLRLLTIAASSWREMSHLLWRARAAKVETVVLLTHPFEFIKGNRVVKGAQRVNRITKRRLRSLCEFIARHDRDFVSTSFAEAAPSWLAGRDVAGQTLQCPLVPTLLRGIENKANELIGII